MILLQIMKICIINQLDEMKSAYSKKERDLEWTYKSKIRGLEKENKYVHKIVDRFKETIKVFVHQVCKKFELGTEDDLVRDFQKENHILLDAEKQIQKEDRQKEWEMELQMYSKVSKKVYDNVNYYKMVDILCYLW